ncbi:MAG TPA: response regulator transcription factor [Abditibacteriaceae bacterium]|nr:response regulator transcription factor [Abditibacteriaceae bacterium]
MRILVVEDEEDFASLVRITLQTEGYQVVTAANGREALEYVASAPSDQKPELVVMDQMMPEMDGIETLRALKADAATAHIPVLMLTAVDQDDNVLQAWKTGVDYYLTKPLDPSALVACIKSLFED